MSGLRSKDRGERSPLRVLLYFCMRASQYVADLNIAKHENGPQNANHKAAPNGGAGPANPKEHYEAAAQYTDKQAVAARCIKTENTETRTTAWGFVFPKAHRCD